MNNHLQIFFLNAIEKNTPPVLVFYLFVLLGVIFVIIKLTNTNYFGQLFSVIGLDKNKFETQASNYTFTKSSLFLNISAIILSSIGFSILTNEFLGSFNVLRNFIAVFLFYVIQVLGFITFSSLVGNKETSFLKNRLSYYELFSLVLFPITLISFYAPINLSSILGVVMLLSLFFTLVRVSIYLTRLISVFHIILYLCTLEIIPVLFLLRFIFN